MRENAVLAKKVVPKFEESLTSLYHAKDGQRYVVASAPPVGMLKSLGIIENAVVEKKLTYKMGGPVLLKIESSEIAIGKEFAEQIMVRG